MSQILEQVKIIFQDEYFLAVDKPHGLVVHNDGRTEELSLVDWVKMNFPELEVVGNPHTLDSGRYANRWGIVNRLDRETSGLVLIAKDETSFLDLQKQFSERIIEKEYVAICHAKAGVDKSGVVTEPLSRHKKDPRIWVLKSDENARCTTRDAETRYQILSIQTKKSSVKDFLVSPVRFFPKTGRTHQIRLHAKFLGIPILGDKKYGFGGIDNVTEIDAKTRLMLHAKSIELLHPKTKNKIQIQTEIPQNFLDL